MYPELQLARGYVVEHLYYPVFSVGIIVCFADVGNQLLAILLHHFARMAVGCEEHLGIMMAKYIVDIDADKDTYLFYVLQLLTQFEITAGTKIANYGMKDVEVGHCCGDAVELVHQRRLDIVEEFGAHKAWRVVRFAFQNITKSYPCNSLLYPRIYWTTYYQTRKHTDKPRAFCFLGGST